MATVTTPPIAPQAGAQEERMNAYACMFWFAVLAVGLLRAQGTIAPRQLEQQTLTQQPLAW